MKNPSWLEEIKQAESIRQKKQDVQTRWLLSKIIRGFALETEQDYRSVWSRFFNRFHVGSLDEIQRRGQIQPFYRFVCSSIQRARF